MPVPQGYSLVQAPDQGGSPSPNLPAGYTLIQSPEHAAGAAPAAPAPQGFFSSLADQVGLSMLGHAIMHPINTAENAAGFVGDVGRAALSPNSDTAAQSTNPITQGVRSMVRGSVDQGGQAIGAAKQGSYGAAASHALLAVPFAGQTMQKAMDQSPDDPNKGYLGNLGNLVTNPGAMGTLTGGSAMLAAPAAGALKRLGGGGILTGAASMVPASLAAPINAIPSALTELSARGVTALGDATQDRGANLMDSYLKAGKKAYRNGAEPGLSVLQQGPGTSVGFTRQGFANGVADARSNVGATIPAIVDGSPAQIARPDLQSGQDAILQSKTNVLNGPGGDPSTIPAFQDLRNTMAPLVDTPGYASPSEVYAAKRNMDENINWGRDVDPKDATVNNTRREMRSDLAGQLYNAVPALRDPSQQYAGLSAASKLATDRTFDTNGSVFSPMRIFSGATTGLLTENATRNPGLSAGIGLATGMIPVIAKLPIVKTGGATALYQLGRGISATGAGLSRLFPAIGSGSEEAAQGSPYAQAGEYQNQGFQQSAPPSGAYGSTNVTPEIIRPGDMSRSRFGVGPDGRSGVLVRPLGRLPAPQAPEPQPTPYLFSPGSVLTPGKAVPSLSPTSLASSIGTAAHTIPSSVLRGIASPGTAAEQASMFRRAQLGSVGDVVPSRLLAPQSPPRLPSTYPEDRFRAPISIAKKRGDY